MDERSDEELMTAFADGNMQSFEALYARHRASLYRYLLRKTRDEATANDLFQGAWEKVIKGRRTYRQTVPFRAWLYRIAYNHSMDFFRRSRPHDSLPLDGIESPVSQPEEQLDRATRAAALERAVLALPVEQQDVLLLRLESGLSIDEMADITGAKRETVKSRLRYAVSKVKQTLAASRPDSNHDS